MTPLTPTLPGYRDIELIAHGTTSLVFRAIQERLDRTVAIKLLLVDQADTTHESVARELATMVRLSAQPHIVSVIDTGTTVDGRPYTVMEFCEGGSYAQILADRGPLPVDEVVEVGTAIGEALHAAHQAGIIHRDVKPSNILRSRFGPALADFGIARAPDELSGTLTREMMTPHHASPEALLHQAQSGPSDVYSLASTMWTLLTGHPPFADPARPALDLLAFRDRVLNEPLPRMPREDVPGWLVAELTLATSKLPAQRHTSAREFAEALRRGALGLPRGAAAAVGMPASPWAPAAAAPVSPPVAAEPVPPQVTAPTTHRPGLPATAWPIWDTGPTPAADVPSPAFDVNGGWAGALPPGPPPTLAAPEWTAPPPAGPPPPPSPRRVPTPVRSATRRPSPPPSRRGTLIGVLVGFTVLGVIAGAVALVRTGPGATAGPQTAPSASAGATGRSAAPAPTATVFLSPNASGAPTHVTLTDNRTSVTLTWTDPTGTGTVAIAISVRTSDGDFLDLLTPAPGRTSAKVSRLDPKINYCFHVTAIYSGDHVASAIAVCTRR